MYKSYAKCYLFGWLILTAIFAVLFYAYNVSQEGFVALEKINNDVQAVKIKQPRFNMTYGSIERENGTVVTENGHIVAMDSTVLISSIGLQHGVWIAPDVFRTRKGDVICFNEENVRVFSYVEAATQNKSFTDVYVRKD